MEDAIEFCAVFKTKEDMVANKPDVTEGLWNDILKVFDLVQVYGTDPEVIEDCANAMDAKNETASQDAVPASLETAEKPAPSENPGSNTLTAKTSEEEKNQSPPVDEQNMEAKKDDDAPMETKFRLDPDDGKQFLKTCGFDDATAESCIAAAATDIAFAIRMAQLSLMPDPKPEPKGNKILVDAECFPPQDSQYPEPFEEMTIEEYKELFPGQPSINIDTVETIPIDDDGIPPIPHVPTGTQEDMESELEGDEPMGVGVDKGNTETVDIAMDKTADEAVAVGMGGFTIHMQW